MIDLFSCLEALIASADIKQKCTGIRQLNLRKFDFSIGESAPPIPIQQAGIPPAVGLVSPRELKKRSCANQAGRNILMHSIAHIEFNAINLAMDACYRFRSLPRDYYHDWLQVADDEARHFSLVKSYLNDHGCDYGDYPAHNGLWDMAARTADDPVARMALVPRVLEARGLDVTPSMIDRLVAAKDLEAAKILTTIYQDEIEHVKIGSKWFKYLCENAGIDYRQTFRHMLEKHFHGEMKGPYNISARLQAGFDAQELDGFT